MPKNTSLPQSASGHTRPKSGFGMVKVFGPAVSVHFDVASLLKPAAERPPSKPARLVRGGPIG